jgi:hypothetical protein
MQRRIGSTGELYRWLDAVKNVGAAKSRSDLQLVSDRSVAHAHPAQDRFLTIFFAKKAKKPRQLIDERS